MVVLKDLNFEGQYITLGKEGRSTAHRDTALSTGGSLLPFFTVSDSSVFCLYPGGVSPVCVLVVCLLSVSWLSVCRLSIPVLYICVLSVSCLCVFCPSMSFLRVLSVCVPPVYPCPVCLCPGCVSPFYPCPVLYIHVLSVFPVCVSCLCPACAAQQRSWLLLQVDIDTRFLQRLNVLDYSFLLAQQPLQPDEQLVLSLRTLIIRTKRSVGSSTDPHFSAPVCVLTG